MKYRSISDSLILRLLFFTTTILSTKIRIQEYTPPTYESVINTNPVSPYNRSTPMRYGIPMTSVAPPRNNGNNYTEDSIGFKILENVLWFFIMAFLMTILLFFVVFTLIQFNDFFSSYQAKNIVVLNHIGLAFLFSFIIVINCVMLNFGWNLRKNNFRFDFNGGF